jgi:NAD(P)-dependent dehydrogenase (short-subunit alcohol dehydrogenase family)
VTGVILVGAGPGLGASVARRFAREGFGVSLVARRASTLAMIQDTLAPYDVPVAGYPADAGRTHQLEQALRTAIDDHGAPDVVIYNAAVVRADGPGELSVDELAHTFAVNVWGALTTALATIPSMQESGHGTFLVTGGMPRPMSNHLSLSLGKAGVRALTSMLADHYRSCGVHVATVTVADEIVPGSASDPDLIAEQYWRLYKEAPEVWRTEANALESDQEVESR